MTDILTRLCLVGAAALFAAWLVLRYRGRIARATDALAKVSRARLAAFLFFVAVATVCAQKPGGTNEPPQGVSPPMLMMGVTPALALLFNSASVSTNGAWDFSAPSGATVHERWRRRGACDIVELWNYGIAEMREWESMRMEAI